MSTKDQNVRDAALGRLNDLRAREKHFADMAKKALADSEALLPEINDLTGFVRIYDSILAETGSNDGVTVTVKDQFPETSGSAETPKTSIKTLFTTMVAEYLQNAAPQNTNALLAYLRAKGQDVPGANPAVYLANILSTSNKFVARRKHGGWFLIEQDPSPKEESPSDTNTEAFNFQPSPEAGAKLEGTQ